jgi:hypothetical protein
MWPRSQEPTSNHCQEPVDITPLTFKIYLLAYYNYIKSVQHSLQLS